MAEKHTFVTGFEQRPHNTVVTSKPLEFQLPGSQTDYGLRFELDSMARLIRIPWVRPLFTFGAAAELDTETQKSRTHISSLEYEGDIGIEMSVGGFKLTKTGPSVAHNITLMIKNSPWLAVNPASGKINY